MSELGQSILAGLEQAIAYMKGEPTNVRVTHYVSADAKTIREQLNLSQRNFAETYGIPLATLQNWEQGRNRPDKTASAYLWSIAKLPDEIKNPQKSIREDVRWWGWVDIPKSFVEICLDDKRGHGNRALIFC